MKPTKTPRTSRMCSDPACDRPLDAKGGRGLCDKHYHRAYVEGNLELHDRVQPQYETVEDRYFSKVEPTGFCWLWNGTVNTNGYGTFGVGGRSGRLVYAHRWSYEWFVGAIPDGLTIDHLFRVPLCVNPDHLEPVTLSENSRRKPLKQYCLRGHDMADAYVRSNGQRMCQKCRKVIRDEKRAARMGGQSHD